MLRDDEPSRVELSGQPADGKLVAAVYKCRVRLEELKDTDQHDVKYCDQCQQRVFKVSDVDGFEQAVAAQRCTWGRVSAFLSVDAERESYYVGKAAGFYEVQPTLLTWDD